MKLVIYLYRILGNLDLQCTYRKYFNKTPKLCSAAAGRVVSTRVSTKFDFCRYVTPIEAC